MQNALVQMANWLFFSPHYHPKPPISSGMLYLGKSKLSIMS